MKPQRIQRKRTKGYKMPENCVSVTRPGKWGNPFSMKPEIENQMNMLSANGKYQVEHLREQVEYAARAKVFLRFREMMNDLNSIPCDEETRSRFRYMRDRIKDLKGKHLACFCPLDSPCHADILLQLANAE